MNKAEFLLKDNEKIVNHKKNIIFLDIDGVIQPYNNTNRFKHDLDGTVNFLTNKYRDTSYKKMDKYDVCAAFYDWDEIGLGILKKALYKCNAYIVLHSGWREYMSLIEAKALFRLYDLEQELINICDKGTKEKVIKKYLEENKNEIDKYIVI
ncbi:HAD domain-containing protein, partial [Thomasclavelia cocleata]|uniref:HAD domain-containing protein n=1 Tax=Thomasclavelia cocleata TaxID=69824 RepID=UPI00256F187D